MSGITFLADLEHYIFDFGKEKDRSRVSLFKDTSGYLVFKVFDKNKNSYSLSYNVSNWKINEKHHVAMSWKLNSINNRDEMHLFVDGFEVPNIIKYGQKLQPYLDEKFRAINKEDIAGSVTKDIVSSIDLITNSSSPVVTSAINFSSLNISPGDTIYIDEVGFSTIGYTILSIAGQSLTLSANMPTTLTDGKFSVNRTNFTVTSDIDVAPNTAVFTMSPIFTGTLDTISANPLVTSAINFIDNDIIAGNTISIDGTSEVVYTILDVSTNALLLNEPINVTLNSANFRIYDGEVELAGTRAIRPDYSISKDVSYNNILTLSNSVFAGDLIVVRTFGLNYRKVKEQYYVWSDNSENTLMTRLPAPISLDEVKISKVIINPIAIGPSNSVESLGIFTKTNFEIYQPIVSVER